MPTPTMPPAGPRLAQQQLKTLPRPTEARRRLYRAQFTDLQCRAWGDRTWAKSVLADAERVIGAAAPALREHEVPGYPLVRLGWLCELTVALEHALRDDALDERATERRDAFSAGQRAEVLRRRAVNRLKAMAPGDVAFQKRVRRNDARRSTPQQLRVVLRRLADFVVGLRQDADLRLLADDCGLTTAFLDELEAAAKALDVLVPKTWRAGPTNDSAATSVIEGRVLREVAFLHDCVARARADGSPVPHLNLPRSAHTASRRR